MKKVLQRISAGIQRRGTEGAFSKQAAAAGESTAAFAAKVHANPDQYDTRTLRRANLARVFAKYRPH